MTYYVQIDDDIVRQHATIRVAREQGDQIAYLMPDLSWQKVPGASVGPVDNGLMLPHQVMEPLRQALNNYLGDSPETQNLKLMREWMEYERGRVDKALEQ